ncbi:MAG: VTT domain-containing protein, partial [Nanoarchaeota archaeon]|nr:VTT domain-containing protein [Nanoarchaeota archaeon]
GIMGSSIIDFYISRKLGKNYVRRYLNKHGGRIEEFEDVLEKNTFKTTLILSAIFFVPPMIPNFLGGIMNINLKNYSIATFVGNLPNTFFTVYLITGLFYLDPSKVYISIIGITITSLTAMYFYNGEIKHLFKLSFPWAFRR